MRRICFVALIAISAAAGAQDLWRVSSFDPTDIPASRDTVLETGDSRGGLVMSGNTIHKTGDDATYRYDSLTLGSPQTGDGIFDTLFYNVRNNQMYAFGISETTMATPGQTATHLLALNSSYGVTGSVALSSSIMLDTGGINGLFSGWDRLLFMDSKGDISRVDLLTGNVTGGVGTVDNVGWSPENWAVWGVAETWGGVDTLVGMAREDDIERYDFSTGNWTQILDTDPLDDASFAVDLSSSSAYLAWEEGLDFEEPLARFGMTYEIAPVPEPASMAALAGGLCLFARKRRKK